MIQCSAVPKTKITDHTGTWQAWSFDLRGGFDFRHNREYRLLKCIKGNICYFYEKKNSCNWLKEKGLLSQK